MKRFLALFLGFFLIVSLTACSFSFSTDNKADTADKEADCSVWMGTYVPFGQYAPQERYIILYKDGAFFHDLPFQGLDRFDRQTSLNDDNEKYYWGTYEVAGKTGTWKYNSSEADPWELKFIKDDQMTLCMDYYYRCQSVDGLRLDGVWSISADPDYQPKSTISFSRDGRFSEAGLMNGIFSFLDEGAGEPGSGTYDIKNFTLYLKYDDGRVRTACFSLSFSSKPESSPGMIYIYRTGLFLISN